MSKNRKTDYTYAFNQLISSHLDISLYSAEFDEEEKPNSNRTTCSHCNKTEGNRGEADLSIAASKSILKSLMIDHDVNGFSAIEQCIYKELTEINTAYMSDLTYIRKTNSVSTFLSVIQKELKNFDICSLLLQYCANNYLPIILIWKISAIVSFEKIFCRWQNSTCLNYLKDDLCYNILHCGSQSERCKVVEMILSSLIFFRYQLSTKPKLKHSAQDVLSHFAQSMVEVCMDTRTEVNSSNDIMDVYGMLIENKTLHQDPLKLFMVDQLKLILTQKTDVLLSSAIQHQSQWSSVSSSKVLIGIFHNIISFLGYSQVLDIFDCVVTTSEVHWGTILTLLGYILIFSQDASVKVRSLIGEYLVKGCKNQDSEHIILGFLFARHASQEGRHVFPSYIQWFASTFGSENSSPTNSKASFSFLVDFLKEMVPYEKRDTLYAHVSQTIYIPSGCRDVYRDYKNLAKARIQELDDALGQSVPMEAEVAKRIAEFEKAGHIPSVLNEMAIFQRGKFLNSFVPILLAPRVLPVMPDARMDLITALVFSSKKVPMDIYNKYQENCKLFAEGSFTESTSVKTKSEDILSLIDSVQKLTSTNENSALSLFSKISHFIKESSFPLQKEKSEELIHSVSLRIISAIGEIYNGENISSLSEKHLLMQQLLSITASNEAVQLQVIKDLCNFSTTKCSKEMATKGVVMAEFGVLEGGCFPNAENSKEINATDLFIKELFSAESVYISCSIVSAWMDWIFTNELCAPDKVHSLYCCLATRLAFTTENNVRLEKYDNLANYHFPVLANGKIPDCCVFFWKHFSHLKKPTISDWVKFELNHKWNDVKWSSSLAFVEFWLHKFFFKNNNGDNFFNEYFSSLLLNVNQSENYSLLVLALQNLTHRLNPKPVIFETWLKLSSVHIDSKLLEQFVSLSMCLPPSMFLSRSLIKESFAFANLINGLLDFISDLFLDLRMTSYFLEAIISAAAQHSDCDVSPLLKALLESVMFHLPFLKNMLEREEQTVVKNPFLKRMRNMADSIEDVDSIHSLITVIRSLGHADIDFRTFHYITSYLGHLIVAQKLSFPKSTDNFVGATDNSIMKDFSRDIDKVLVRLETEYNLSDYLRPDWCTSFGRTYRRRVLYVGTIYVILCYISNKEFKFVKRTYSSNSFNSYVLCMLHAYQELAVVSEDSIGILLLEIRKEIVRLINVLPSLYFDKWQYESIGACDSELIAAVDKKLERMDIS